MRYIIGVGLILTVVSVGVRAADEGGEPKLKPGDAQPPVVPSAWEEVTEQDAPPGFNASRGNWFFKSQILKKAIEPVKEVQRVVKETIPFREMFENRHKKFTGDLDLFLQDYGFDNAQVTTQLAAVIDEIKRKEQLMQQPPPRVAPRIDPKTGKRMPLPPLPNYAEEIQKLKTVQADIEKLGQKMARLRKIEAAAAESIRVLGGVMDKASETEKKAWGDYEKIADTLSDVVAEDMYRSIEVALANVKSIREYCSGTFESFFSDLEREMSVLEGELKAVIEVLVARGYAFGKKATERLETEKRAAEEAARLKALQAPKKPEPVSWWGTIAGYFAAAWNAVVNAVKSVGKMVMGLFGR